jgi:hypothetical protein
MARANLLGTTTTSLLDLVGNGRTFHVPPYQRDYSWTKEQWEDLWNDLLDLIDKPGDTHYMGALVVSASDDRMFAVIDGQQRLATLSLVALAVIDHLGRLADAPEQLGQNVERAKALRSRFIGDRDPASLVEASKLRLNETDDGFYQDHLVQLRAPRALAGMPKSNRLLFDAFDYLRKRVAEEQRIANDGETLARFLSETVGRQLIFIRITVDDEVNAYTVFETLNARGLELTATDLLKNYLFSLVNGATDRKHMQRRWSGILATIGAKRFPALLRYHLMCELPRVRSQRLFKLVQERVRDGAQALALIDVLERRAEVMAALRDPAGPFWTDMQEAREHVAALELFRVTQFMPVLFAADEIWCAAPGSGRTPNPDFTRLVRLIAIIAFRYVVIGDQNTNAIELATHQAAKAIFDGAATGPADVFARLRLIYPSDDQFERDFTTFVVDERGEGRKIARYILVQLERDAGGGARDWRSDPATLEHILPTHPSDDWGSEDEFNIGFATERLGNLALLEAPKNRDAANKRYADKRKIYETSTYRTTQAIAEMAPELWTTAHIEKRQADMARRAVHVWRAGFDRS